METKVEFLPLPPDHRKLLADPSGSAEALRLSPRFYEEDTGDAELLLLDSSTIINYLKDLELSIVQVFNVDLDSGDSSRQLMRSFKNRAGIS